MKLFHFTSSQHAEGCRREGLTKGAIPMMVEGKYGLSHGWQWLTSNPDFKQEWANPDFSTLPYDRTGVRFTIVIPKTARSNLYRWLDVSKSPLIDPAMNAFGDPENWWVFKGRVKPAWIRKVVEKDVTL